MNSTTRKNNSKESDVETRNNKQVQLCMKENFHQQGLFSLLIFSSETQQTGIRLINKEDWKTGVYTDLIYKKTHFSFTWD